MKTTLALAISTGFAVQLSAVTIGQVQTFDGPSTNWVTGVGPGGGTPTPVPTAFGGPGGANDPYLSIISTGGSGPGSRPSAQNFTEWAGDYIASGVSSIRMDVNNFGPNELSLRLLFVQFAGQVPVSAAFTSNALTLTPGSGWQTVNIDIRPSALTAVTIPPLTVFDPAVTLANVSEFRIFHNPDPSFPLGNLPAIAANLGIDNITAVPEPGTCALTAAGLLIACAAVRKRRVN